MYKQVIVFNRSILKKVGKGKLAAHVAHASLAALREAERIRPGLVKSREARGAKKIVVKADEAELLRLYEVAKIRGLPVALVRDAGHTQIPPGTITALGIGPAPERLIDRLTRHLKLLRAGSGRRGRVRGKNGPRAISGAAQDRESDLIFFPRERHGLPREHEVPLRA